MVVGEGPHGRRRGFMKVSGLKQWNPAAEVMERGLPLPALPGEAPRRFIEQHEPDVVASPRTPDLVAQTDDQSQRQLLLLFFLAALGLGRRSSPLAAGAFASLALPLAPSSPSPSSLLPLAMTSGSRRRPRRGVVRFGLLLHDHLDDVQHDLGGSLEILTAGSAGRWETSISPPTSIVLTSRSIFCGIALTRQRTSISRRTCSSTPRPAA